MPMEPTTEIALRARISLLKGCNTSAASAHVIEAYQARNLTSQSFASLMTGEGKITVTVNSKDMLRIKSIFSHA